MFRSTTIIGSLQLCLAKVILMLKHSVRLHRNVLCCGVAASPSMPCVLCALFCAEHNTHAILRHAATTPRNKLRCNLAECFNINLTLATINCKLPDDGRRPKHVGAI
jgi:hypothetical protein